MPSVPSAHEGTGKAVRKKATRKRWQAQGIAGKAMHAADDISGKHLFVHVSSDEKGPRYQNREKGNNKKFVQKGGAQK